MFLKDGEATPRDRSPLTAANLVHEDVRERRQVAVALEPSQEHARRAEQDPRPRGPLRLASYRVAHRLAQALRALVRDL